MQVQFVDHFSGCQLCTQQSKDKGAYRECEAEFLRSYEFASGALRELQPPPAPRNATHFKQLAATPYCLVGRPAHSRLHFPSWPRNATQCKQLAATPYGLVRVLLTANSTFLTCRATPRTSAAGRHALLPGARPIIVS